MPSAGKHHRPLNAVTFQSVTQVVPSPGTAQRMLTRGFDPAELHRAGVDLGSLPDEHGYLIAASALPKTFAEELEREGLDTSRPIRVIGIIGRRPDGRPDRYTIHFKQD
jgi:hypothetical protein